MQIIYFRIFFANGFSSLQVWQTFNGLFIIRCLIKYIIETGSEYQLLQHFEALPNDKLTTQQTATDEATTSLQANEIEFTPNISIVPIDGCKFDSFFDAVVNMIVVIPVKYVWKKFGSKIVLAFIFFYEFFQGIYIPFTFGSG